MAAQATATVILMVTKYLISRGDNATKVNTMLTDIK